MCCPQDSCTPFSESYPNDGWEAYKQLLHAKTHVEVRTKMYSTFSLRVCSIILVQVFIYLLLINFNQTINALRIKSK